MTLAEMREAARRGYLAAWKLVELERLEASADMQASLAQANNYIAQQALGSQNQSLIGAPSRVQAVGYDNYLQGFLQNQRIPKSEDEVNDFLRRQLEEAQEELGECSSANLRLTESNLALRAELAQLRSRTAERDASISWAIRRGR